MNKSSITKRTLEYPTATLYEFEISIANEQGMFCNDDSSLKPILTHLVDAEVFSLSIVTGQPLTFVIRSASGSEALNRVQSILSRCCIPSGFLQTEWMTNLSR